MDSPKSGNTTPIANAKGKAPADAPAPVIVTTKATPYPQGKWKKCVAIFDFIFRLCAIGAAFAATATMGTTEQILPFFTQFLQFHAQYNDLPAFTSFVIANATAAAYLVLSLPFSIVCIVRPHAIRPRRLLATFDTVMVAVTIAGASGAAAIVYLAHNGNSNANWNAICQQFDAFCASASSAVVASYVAALMFMFLVALSAFALKRT